MKTKMIWGNLAVSDIERTTKFYTALGFKQNGTPNAELTSFLFGDGNFIIHFFTKERLKVGMEGEIVDLKQGNEIIFSLSAASKDEVDEWAVEAEEAGATIFSAPKSVMDKGYGFGFADPDGHKFNVLYWPK